MPTRVQRPRPPGEGTSGPALGPLRARGDRKKLRIANFVGLSGPSGIWGPASINSTLLGVSEINRRGGVLGREIEVAFHDTGGDINEVTRTAADIVASEEADLVMGIAKSVPFRMRAAAKAEEDVSADAGMSASARGTGDASSAR